MEFGILLRIVAAMNLVCILSCLFNIQGREPFLHDFVFIKNLNIGFHSDI